MVNCFDFLPLTSGTWSILRYWWSVSSFQSGQGSRFMGLGFGPSVGIEIGNSGAVGFLMEQEHCYWASENVNFWSHPKMTKFAQRLLITLAISQSMGVRLNTPVEKR